MQVFHKLEDVPADFGPTVASVGNFDGVHRAHCFVLSEIVKRAKAVKAKSMAVTFEPHPTRILRPDSTFKLLTPTPEKLRLLAARLRACEVHEGYNFHFGHKASGNIHTLRELGREMGFEVHDYPEMRLRGEPVSSSHIRQLLREGRVSRARHLLARPFSILSTAGRGRGYGSKYTVPTINLARYEELVPKDGVYISRTRLGDQCFDSVTNIGNRPTFGADSFAVESHLLNFHPLEVTADTEVEIHFLDRLRDEIKFPSVEALREQIGRDVAKSQKYFRRLKASD